MLQNDELHILLRKNQNTLSVIGLGVIAFGIWSVIKAVMYSAFDLSGTMATMLTGSVERIAYWIILGIGFAIALGLRLYVGLSAMNESRGKQKRRFYIVLAYLIAAFSFLLFVTNMIGLFRHGTPVGVSLASGIVEATSCILLVEMAVSAVRVRRLRVEIEEQES